MSLVTLEEKSSIALITLNNPKTLNAMCEQMAKEFEGIVSKLFISAPKAIILTGHGEAFSAGGDLEMLSNKRLATPEENRLSMLSFYNSFLGIRDLGIPLIAAINGTAIGAGLCLAAACDIRIATAGSKLGFIFCNLGLYPGMGATYFVPKIIGVTRATELFLTGKMFTAESAKDFGLISEVVAKQEHVTTRAITIAENICSNITSTTAKLLKALRPAANELSQYLENEAIRQAESYSSPEFAARIEAAIGKKST